MNVDLTPDSVEKFWPELTSEAAGKISEFYRKILAENEVQNLTRLTTPELFLENAVADARELLKSDLLGWPAMDLGSGAGIPGLICAIAQSGQWILVESEVRKAEFLDRMVEEFGLKAVTVVPERAEIWLKKGKTHSITAKAVGPVSRIHGWLRNCSTWNNLVLLKGPGWDKEWEEFLGGRYRNELEIAGEHIYRVGTDQRERRIVRLLKKEKKIR